MSQANPKNFALSLAATDLGLGQMLSQQLQDQEAELKKKQQSLNPQASMFASASMDLLGKING